MKTNVVNVIINLPLADELNPTNVWELEMVYPLVMTNIAMDNDPFIDGLPITNGDFPWLC